MVDSYELGERRYVKLLFFSSYDLWRRKCVLSVLRDLFLATILDEFLLAQNALSLAYFKSDITDNFCLYSRFLV